MIPCYIFTAILFVIKLYHDYIACIMCLEFDRLETVIVYVLIKFCSVLFCSFNIKVNDPGVLNNSIDLLSFVMEYIVCDCYFVSNKQFIAKEESF